MNYNEYFEENVKITKINANFDFDENVYRNYEVEIMVK
jgi:hypothetical protein